MPISLIMRPIQHITAVDAVEDGWMGLDIAEKTIKEFSDVIENSKTILWNGPMGVFRDGKILKGNNCCC